MADVFISYAREDHEFVRRLTDALKDRGHDSWVDWEKIEPSDVWRQSIREAIDGADVFVLILSPDSLASQACRDEVEHAAREHKRVIGLVCRDVEGLEIPQEVEQLNWVFLRDQDDLEAGLTTFERALNLDLDLVRIHTRVLTRAKGWELSGRRPAPLLRGDELRSALGWLARAAAGSEPQPTELQAEFVEESRQRARTRQRRAVMSLVSIALAAVALASFALIQRTQARHQARVAQSRELATRAEAELVANPEDAIALAQHGLRVQRTPQAIHALWHALQASRLRIELRQASPVKAVAFSPDGKLLAIGGGDGAVRLWRLSDRHLIWSQGRGRPAATSIAFAHAGDLLAVSRGSAQVNGTGCAVDVLSAASGAVQRTPYETAGSSPCQTFVGFVRATRTLAIGDYSGVVRLVDTDRGGHVATVNSLRVPPLNPSVGGFVFSMGFSADGRLAASAGNDSIVRVASLPSGRPIAIIESPDQLKPDALAFSPDNNRLLIGSKYKTAVYDLRRYAQVGQLQGQFGVTLADAWSPDDRLLAAATAGGTVNVWSQASGRSVEVLPGASSQPMTAVAFSSTGELAGGSLDGTVRVWSPDPDLPLHRSLHSAGAASGAAPKKHLAVFSALTGVILTDDRGRVVKRLKLPGASAGFAVGAGGYLAVTTDSALAVLKLPSGKRVRSWRLATNKVFSFAISADGRVAAAVVDDTVTLLSDGRRASATVPNDPDSDITSVALSPDGRLLAVGGAAHPSGTRLFRTDDMRRLGTERGSNPVFSVTGRLMAIQRPDLSIAVLRTGDRKTVSVMRGATGITGLGFSPDERLLGAGGQDGVLRVWDVHDGTLLSTRYVTESSIETLGPPQSISPPVLTAAGYALVTANHPPSIQTFDACRHCLDPAALLAQAEARLRDIRPVSAP